MPTKIINKTKLLQWVAQLKVTPVVAILFSHDCLSAIDEAVALELDGQIVAVACLAPSGEDMSGQPSIISLYTLKAHRHKGYGRMVLKAAIARCTERGFPQVRYDTLSEAEERIIESLPPEERALLVVHEHERLFDEFMFVE